jgi:hypothetical protein
MSEDCLYLNIFTPPTATGPLPVFFWSKSLFSSRLSSFFSLCFLYSLPPSLFSVYGGDFIFGWTSDYPGGELSSTQDMIVVTISYRLSVLGFFALDEMVGTPLNAGLLDQQMALKWVYNNIAAFGGDPTRITIGGESAGGKPSSSSSSSSACLQVQGDSTLPIPLPLLLLLSLFLVILLFLLYTFFCGTKLSSSDSGASTSFHLLFPSSWPYYRSAILESPGPWSFYNLTTQIDLSVAWAVKHGCQFNNGSMLACMRENWTPDLQGLAPTSFLSFVHSCFLSSCFLPLFFPFLLLSPLFLLLILE